ncbi:MAG: hypothetical protein WDW36_006508 [Sanguina aurantia]
MTVTTGLSLNRLHQLKAQCMTWPGALSAVVYLAIIQDDNHASLEPIIQQEVKDRLSLTLDEARARVTAFHNDMEHMEGSCVLDVMLVYEVVDDAFTASLYPSNVVRNFARLQARSPLIGLFDVDMLLSSALALELSTPGMASQPSGSASSMEALLPLDGKVALIVPAFDINAATARDHFEMAEIADRAVLFTKQEMVQAFKSNNITRFDPRGSGHLATNYSHWCEATESYPVLYMPWYEPWVVVNRIKTPWFDMRFRGYGRNKITHLDSLDTSGYTLMVHPTAFIVHRAHAVSSARQQWNKVVPSKSTQSTGSTTNPAAALPSLTKPESPTAAQSTHSSIFNQVNGYCNGFTHCVFSGDAAWFGAPATTTCVGTAKYTTVTYVCVSPATPAPTGGSTALGFYNIIGSTPGYAIGMLHLPGSDNYVQLST